MISQVLDHVFYHVSSPSQVLGVRTWAHPSAHLRGFSDRCKYVQRKNSHGKGHLPVGREMTVGTRLECGHQVGE